MTSVTKLVFILEGGVLIPADFSQPEVRPQALTGKTLTIQTRPSNWSRFIDMEIARDLLQQSLKTTLDPFARTWRLV